MELRGMPNRTFRLKVQSKYPLTCRMKAFGGFGFGIESAWLADWPDRFLN